MRLVKPEGEETLEAVILSYTAPLSEEARLCDRNNHSCVSFDAGKTRVSYNVVEK